MLSNTVGWKGGSGELDCDMEDAQAELEGVSVSIYNEH